MIPTARGSEPERDTRAKRRRSVARGGRLGQELAERSLGSLGVLPEPEPDLGVREPKLALRGLVQVGAGLEVVGGDAQLPREHP